MDPMPCPFMAISPRLSSPPAWCLERCARHLLHGWEDNRCTWAGWRKASKRPRWVCGLTLSETSKTKWLWDKLENRMVYSLLLMYPLSVWLQSTIIWLGKLLQSTTGACRCEHSFLNSMNFPWGYISLGRRSQPSKLNDRSLFHCLVRSS